MSARLISEVLEHAPHINGTEKLILIAIAWRAFHDLDTGANPRTASGEDLPPRQTFIHRKELEQWTGCKSRAISQAITSLERKGLPIRVKVTTNDGRTTTAFRGHATRYRLPTPDQLDRSRPTPPHQPPKGAQPCTH